MSGPLFSGLLMAQAKRKFRYIRWHITEVRDDSGGGIAIHASEFRLVKSGVPIAWNGGVSITCDVPEIYYPVANLLDGTTAKWRAKQTGFVNEAVVDIDNVVPIEFDAYQYRTADNSTWRDPVDWTLWVSKDGTNWTLLDTVVGASIPTSRNTWTSLFNF